MLLSCSISVYGQREINEFEPDYNIDYCVHELLYSDLKRNGTYPVPYADFFSNHALKNGYSHCKIEEFTSDSLVRNTIDIFYNKKGLIKSITRADTKSKHVSKYKYRNNNKTVTKRTDGKFKEVFYFSDNLLIDSIRNDYKTVIYTYDSTTRINHIKKIAQGKVENFYINQRFEFSNSDRPLPDISKAMAGSSPESLFSIDSAQGKKYQSIGIQRDGKYFVVLRGKSSLFLDKLEFQGEGGVDIHKYTSFYKWDGNDDLICYSHYHSNLGLNISLTYGRIDKREADLLTVAYFGLKDFKNKKYHIHSDRIELPNKLISYYK